MELDGKKVLVVGLGMSGVAAARFLAGRGAKVSVNDAKDEQALMGRLAELEGLPFEYYLGGHPEEAFLSADMIVLSPGVPAALESLCKAADKGIPVIAEVELASRFLGDRIVGVDIVGKAVQQDHRDATRRSGFQVRHLQYTCGDMGDFRFHRSPFLSLSIPAEKWAEWNDT